MHQEYGWLCVHMYYYWRIAGRDATLPRWNSGTEHKGSLKRSENVLNCTIKHLPDVGNTIMRLLVITFRGMKKGKKKLCRRVRIFYPGSIWSTNRFSLAGRTDKSRRAFTALLYKTPGGVTLTCLELIIYPPLPETSFYTTDTFLRSIKRYSLGLLFVFTF